MSCDCPRSLRLPSWIDELIFNQLGAKYCRSCNNMTVIDWDRKDVLNYLGTYFPRSYTESYFITSDFLSTHSEECAQRDSVSILDFGCGTGGEIAGMLQAIEENRPNIRHAYVRGIDGNQKALRFCERILQRFSSERLEVSFTPSPIVIDDFYDLGIVDQIIQERFDFFITFKAICEFVTKQQFEISNPYDHIIRTFKNKVESGGVMCIADVSTFNQTSNEWLPKMLDKGISSTGCNVILKNKGWNEAFHTTHSRHAHDLSKLTWRFITFDGGAQ